MPPSPSSGSTGDTSLSRARNSLWAVLRRRWRWGLGGALIAIGLVVWAALSGPEAVSNPGAGVAEVTRGSLTPSVIESGEVEAERRELISNELQWHVIIKSVVPDGSLVQEGDVIIEFECKELLDEIDKIELDLENSRNKYVQAKENLALKRKEMDSNVAKARDKLVEVEDKRVRYSELESSIKQNDLDTGLNLAEISLELKRGELEFKIIANEDLELKENPPYSEKDIRVAELEVQRQELAVRKARDQLNMFLKYDNPQAIRRLATAIESTKLDLERAELERNRQVLIAEDNERSTKRRMDMQQKRLEELLEEKEKLIVKAEQTGLVVYDTGGRYYRPSTVNVQEGEKISPRQQLMKIPDMTSLQIRTRVYEAYYKQVQPGQEAIIRLDSDPGRAMKGKVKRVAILPETKSWINRGVKTFAVFVECDELDEELKPGMTAHVELILARLVDVLKVPVAAVFTEQETTYVWRLAGGKAQRVEIEIGQTSDSAVEVLSGVEEGDKVLLLPPEGMVAEEEAASETSPAPEPEQERPDGAG